MQMNDYMLDQVYIACFGHQTKPS